jgi:hypothetical protein
MKRGCPDEENDDRDTRNSFSAPSGKGRKRAPSRQPTPPPEMSDDQEGGRCPENVLREGLAAFFSGVAARMAREAATDAKKLAGSVYVLEEGILKEQKKARFLQNAQRHAGYRQRQEEDRLIVDEMYSRRRCLVTTGAEGPEVPSYRTSEGDCMSFDPEAPCVPIIPSNVIDDETVESPHVDFDDLSGSPQGPARDTPPKLGRPAQPPDT